MISRPACHYAQVPSEFPAPALSHSPRAPSGDHEDSGEGCGHGELDKIYAAMKHLEEREGVVIDLLICWATSRRCNLDDLDMSVPKAHLNRHLLEVLLRRGCRAYPTIFIGGNHEAITTYGS